MTLYLDQPLLFESREYYIDSTYRNLEAALYILWQTKSPW